MRAAFRWVLAGFMVFAGISHLVSADAFLGQVPTWLPFRTPIVWVSGVIEIGLGVALALTRGTWRRRTGWALAFFLLLVFPGNLYQAIAGTDAFGLDTPVRALGSARVPADPHPVGAVVLGGVASRRSLGVTNRVRTPVPSPSEAQRNVGELDRREGGRRELLVEPLGGAHRRW